MFRAIRVLVHWLLLFWSCSILFAAPFTVCVTHAVAERGVAARLGQQQLDDLDVAVLAGAHKRRGSLVVLDVDVGPESQQSPNHVHPAVTDRQHQPRLTRLKHSRDNTNL